MHLLVGQLGWLAEAMTFRAGPAGAPAFGIGSTGLFSRQLLDLSELVFITKHRTPNYIFSKNQIFFALGFRYIFVC